MNMGNTVHRAGIEPTSLASRASVVTSRPVWSPLYYAYLPMQLLARDLSTAYYTRLPGIVSLLLLKITFIQAFISHIHRAAPFPRGQCSLLPLCMYIYVSFIDDINSKPSGDAPLIYLISHTRFAYTTFF